MREIRVTERQIAAYGHFLSASSPFIHMGAAAMVGNFCQESGENLNSTMFRSHPDPSGGQPEALKSGGIAEWLGDRKSTYITFSQRVEAEHGLPKWSLLDDLATQCDFAINELRSDYPNLYKMLTVDTGRSVATLTMNVMMAYERPKLGPTDGRDTRIAYAEAIFAHMSTMPSQPAPPSPIPQVPAPIPQTPETPIPAPSPSVPPISAGSAGRLAAEQKQIDAMLLRLIAERDSINQEIALFQTLRSGLEKLLPISESAPLSPLITSHLTESSKGIQKMFGITSWKTTFGGIASILTAAGAAAHALSDGDFTAAYDSLPGIIAGIGLIAAKDGNVTGGTKPATNEAIRRISGIGQKP